MRRETRSYGRLGRFAGRAHRSSKAAEDRDEYAAENVFWAPLEARWSPVEPSPVRAVVTVRSAAGGPLPGADVVLTLDPPDGIELAGLAWPEPILLSQQGADGPLAVFEETFAIGAALVLDPGLTPGTYAAPGVLRYQACDETRRSGGNRPRQFSGRPNRRQAPDASRRRRAPARTTPSPRAGLRGSGGRTGAGRARCR